MKIDFTTIASGSSGNCVYVGTENTKVLFDAGISGKKVEEGLKGLDICGSDIDAIFVTHEHTDHIKGVGVMSRKYNIPIYATEGTWDAMKDKIGKIREENIRYVYKREKNILNDLCISSFEIPHDAAEPVGYSIMTDKVKIAIATDIGHVTREILDNLKECDAMLLESNHDVDMLKDGSYTYELKRRILGKYGHLSNETAGKLLACVLSDKLKYIFLGHLSNENNTPKLAYNTVKDILKEYGVDMNRDLDVSLAERYCLSRVYELRG